MIRKIWKKSKSNSEMIWKIWKKGKLNSEMIWKIWKISVLVIITPKEISSSSSFSKLTVFIIFLMAICSLISPFVLCFPCFFSVSNFYFTSQYHQFPLSHPAAAEAFSSHTQQQQPYTPEQQPYIPKQQQQQQPPLSLLKFHPRHVANKNKTKHIMKMPHINISYEKATLNQQNSD